MGFFDDINNQNEIRKKAEKGKSPFAPGAHEVKLASVSSNISKKGVPFMILKFDDGVHKPIEELFMFDTTNKYYPDKMKKLGVWFVSAFGEMPAVTDVQSPADECDKVASWAQKHVGKPLRVLVKAKEELFSKEEDGEFKLIKFWRNSILTIGSIRTVLSVNDVSSLTEKLNAEDQAKYDAYIAKVKRAKAQKKKEEEGTSSNENEPSETEWDAGVPSEDDIPF